MNYNRLDIKNNPLLLDSRNLINFKNSLLRTGEISTKRYENIQEAIIINYNKNFKYSNAEKEYLDINKEEKGNIISILI
jgi:hypothetical protein